MTGIAGKKDFLVISLYKNRMKAERGFIRRILAILEDFNCSFEHIPAGIDNVSVVIAKSDIGGRLKELMRAFEKQLEPDSMECFTDMALIVLAEGVQPDTDAAF